MYDNNPIESIYRVTDYRHPWDEYDGWSIFELEDFGARLEWNQLPVFLNRYPLRSPTRYLCGMFHEGLDHQQ